MTRLTDEELKTMLLYADDYGDHMEIFLTELIASREALKIADDALKVFTSTFDHHWSCGYNDLYSDSDEKTECKCGIYRAKEALSILRKGDV